MAKKLKGFISESSGTVSKVYHIGIVRLSYSIRKMSQGRYYIMHVECSPHSISLVDKYMKINEGILRHSILNLEKVNQANLTKIITANDKDKPAPAASDPDFSALFENLN
jgi:small subunit ribosomal protein S6